MRAINQVMRIIIGMSQKIGGHLFLALYKPNSWPIFGEIEFYGLDYIISYINIALDKNSIRGRMTQ